MAINIRKNPFTTFLAPANATVNTINRYVVEVLFGNQTPLMTVTNGQQILMPIYQNISCYNRKQVFFFILCVPRTFYIDSIKFVSMFNFGLLQNLFHNFVPIVSYVILATIQVTANLTSKLYMYNNRLY